MFAELHCRSYFSFLDGASPPEDLVARAHALGYQALAITDVDGVYGLPRAHSAAKSLGLHLIAGAEVTVAEDEAAARAYQPAGRVVLLALDRDAWGRLCRLLTTGRMRHEKGRGCVSWAELAAAGDGLVVLTGGIDGPVDRALAAQDLAGARRWAGRLREVFGERAHAEVSIHLRPGEPERLEALARLADEVGLPVVATQGARYATAHQRVLHDVQTCVRLGVALQEAGRALAANGEAHLRPVAEVRRRFAAWPEAVERAMAIAAQARFSLDELRYRFPAADLPAGETPASYLRQLTWAGAARRYKPITAKVNAQLEHELGLIERLGLAGYFLIVWDIVQFCEQKKILCQGRGSAANSAVCYSLGITAIDPVGMELLFERFLSEERGKSGGAESSASTEMPDIDLDIAHQRREEVIQHVFQKYGRARAAMANEVITYRARSAIRDVGKALGLSLAQVDAAAKAVDRFDPDGQTDEPEWSKDGRHRTLAKAQLGGLDTSDPTVRRVVALAQGFDGFPRHIGIHSGGMVLAEGDLCEVVPIENASMPGRSVVQWDKDDLNGLGIVKIDLLGLGMLTAVDDALRLVSTWTGQPLEMHTIPKEDPAVYDMICAADTIGVFQIESRAQMSMLPRLRPVKFYDLVIEVAIIRPGPIQGDMVHPFLRRRNGEESVDYPHPMLEQALGRTLGVPLFQEQGMRVAIIAGGFTPGEADELRRAMGHKRSHERMAALKARLLAGMAKNGIPESVGERVFKELSAFADYGFPESHAASFALIVYASAWLKRHHPAAFTAALLNAQPMGFYAPHSLVADARRHGVTVKPVCAKRSAWAATLERQEGTSAPALRLGMSTVRGLGDQARTRFEAARAAQAFRSIGDFARRSGLPRGALEALAGADGFAAFGLARREALWQVTALPRDLDVGVPLVTNAPPAPDPIALRAMDAQEELVADFVGLGLSIDRNPLALVRAKLKAAGILSCAELGAGTRHGERRSVAGMVIVRQRPATAKGMVFMTLEDESGLANLVFTPDVYERLRPVARDEPLVVTTGRIERQGSVVNLRVEGIGRLTDVTGVTVAARNFH